MSKSFEEIRSEILELDRETQERLVDELTASWDDDIPEEAFAEAARRMEAYHRGDSGGVSAEDSLARARRTIEEFKKAHA